MTPHQAIAQAIDELPAFHNECSKVSCHHPITEAELASVAIEALRAGAMEQVLASCPTLDTLSAIHAVNAILGEPL